MAYLMDKTSRSAGILNIGGYKLYCLRSDGERQGMSLRAGSVSDGSDHPSLMLPAHIICLCLSSSLTSRPAQKLQREPTSTPTKSCGRAWPAPPRACLSTP